MTNRTAIAAVVAEIRTEHDVRHGVGRPLQSNLGIPGIRTSVVLVSTIAKLRKGRAKESLRVALREGITIAVVPAYATVEGQLASLLIVHIQTDHLCSGQSLTAHTETATAATAAEAA